MTATKSNQALTPAQMFFYTHAGYSYPTGTDPEQGHVRCAILLERAESLYLDAHCVADVRFEFGNDHWYPMGSKREPDQFYQATLWHGEHCLASVGGIDDDSDTYRRVVRAELAQEASDELRAIVKAAQ